MYNQQTAIAQVRYNQQTGIAQVRYNQQTATAQTHRVCNKQENVIAFNWRHTYHKGHNPRDQPQSPTTNNTWHASNYNYKVNQLHPNQSCLYSCAWRQWMLLSP